MNTVTHTKNQSAKLYRGFEYYDYLTELELTSTNAYGDWSGDAYWPSQSGFEAEYFIFTNNIYYGSVNNGSHVSIAKIEAGLWNITESQITSGELKSLLESNYQNYKYLIFGNSFKYADQGTEYARVEGTAQILDLTRCTSLTASTTKHQTDTLYYYTWSYTNCRRFTSARLPARPADVYNVGATTPTDVTKIWEELGDVTTIPRMAYGFYVGINPSSDSEYQTLYFPFNPKILILACMDSSERILAETNQKQVYNVLYRPKVFIMPDLANIYSYDPATGSTNGIQFNTFDLSGNDYAHMKLYGDAKTKSVKFNGFLCQSRASYNGVYCMASGSTTYMWIIFG